MSDDDRPDPLAETVAAIDGLMVRLQRIRADERRRMDILTAMEHLDIAKHYLHLATGYERCGDDRSERKP